MGMSNYADPEDVRDKKEQSKKEEVRKGWISLLANACRCTPYLLPFNVKLLFVILCPVDLCDC